MPEKAWHRRARFARSIIRMAPPKKVAKLGPHHGSSPSLALLVASEQPAGNMPGQVWGFKGQARATDLTFKIHHSAYELGSVAKCNGNTAIGGSCEKNVRCLVCLPKDGVVLVATTSRTYISSLVAEYV